GPRLLQLDAPHAEVGLGARPEPGGPVRAVELEDDPLALPQRPEDRPLEGAGGQGVLRPVGVADDGALARPGVVGLDHALHRGTLRLPAYHAAVSPSRYAGGLAERRIRVPGAAAPGAAGTAVRSGRRRRRHRRPRRRSALRHRRPHRGRPLRPALVDAGRRRLEGAGRQPLRHRRHGRRPPGGGVRGGARRRPQGRGRRGRRRAPGRRLRARVRPRRRGHGGRGGPDGDRGGGGRFARERRRPPERSAARRQRLRHGPARRAEGRARRSPPGCGTRSGGPGPAPASGAPAPRGADRRHRRSLGHDRRLGRAVVRPRPPLPGLGCGGPPRGGGHPRRAGGHGRRRPLGRRRLRAVLHGRRPRAGGRGLRRRRSLPPGADRDGDRRRRRPALDTGRRQLAAGPERLGTRGRVRPPVALTVAGTDSGGGAGIAADLKTFAAHGVWGTFAVTAVTAQNTLGVAAVEVLRPDIVAAQIGAVAGDFAIAAMKTGMLGDAAVVEAVATAVEEWDLHPLVVDPVAVASAGGALLSPDGLEALRTRLLPLADLVAPNLAEAAALAGLDEVPSDEAGVERAAAAVLDLGPRGVLLTGGHLPGPESPDLLMWRGPAEEVWTVIGHSPRQLSKRWLPGRRINAPNTHGTGCVLSAAVTARLARGEDLVQAVEGAKEFVTAAIAAGVDLGAGPGA